MIAIAFLIPVKTDKLDEESKIYNLVNNFFRNLHVNYKYNFYIGFNHADPCLANRDIFNKFVCSNLSVNVIEFPASIQPGHLTAMWNLLAKGSFKHNTFFYQLGDDIEFDTYDFFDRYISTLCKTNGLGVTGFLTKNGNTQILTQSFVSRLHLIIFGFYFPTEIRNWYCDNWISEVYKYFSLYFPLEQRILNSSEVGNERYRICLDQDGYNSSLKAGLHNLNNYILKQVRHNSHWSMPLLYMSKYLGR